MIRAFIAGIVVAYAVPLCVWLAWDIVRTQREKREALAWLRDLSVPPAVGATRNDRGHEERWTGSEWADA